MGDTLSWEKVVGWPHRGIVQPAQTSSGPNVTLTIIQQAFYQQVEIWYNSISLSYFLQFFLLPCCLPAGPLKFLLPGPHHPFYLVPTILPAWPLAFLLPGPYHHSYLATTTHPTWSLPFFLTGSLPFSLTNPYHSSYLVPTIPPTWPLPSILPGPYYGYCNCTSCICIFRFLSNDMCIVYHFTYYVNPKPFYNT